MGRHVDAMVAEKVMGWRVCGPDDPLRLFAPDGGCIIEGLANRIPQGIIPVLWFPSEEIYDAWEVFEKLSHREPVVSTDGAGRLCTMLASDRPDDVVHTWQGDRIYTIERIHVEGLARTASLAICLAALRACGVDEADIQRAVDADAKGTA